MSHDRALVDRVAEAMTGWPLDSAGAEDAEGWRANARAALDALAREPHRDGQIIASFPLPAEWGTVERMLNAVWQDGPDWCGANTVSGAEWILEVRDGNLVVIDRPRE